MQRHLLLTVVLGTMLAAACDRQRTAPAQERLTSAPTAPPRVRQFLGEYAIAVLSDPQSVEVYRVKDRPPVVNHATTQAASAPDSDSSIGGFAIIAKGETQDRDFGMQLAQLFMTDRPYLFDVAKGCMFQADTAVRVNSPNGYVDFVLCFGCSEFILSVHDLEGRRLGGGGSQHFDGVEDELRTLVDKALKKSVKT